MQCPYCKMRIFQNVYLYCPHLCYYCDRWMNKCSMCEKLIKQENTFLLDYDKPPGHFEVVCSECSIVAEKS